MTKVIAYLSLLVLMLGASLGNYWYTFGIWPRSWWAFAAFFFLQSVLMGLVSLVGQDNKS